MLCTETRRLYTECLEAPLGYRFHSGIAATFTLSLETLLILPFTLAGLGTAEPESLVADPVALLESLQETGNRLAVFCHDGYIAVPPREQLLYGLLDRCVVPVRPRRAPGLFHPKLWLLRFTDDAGGVVLRAVVLSRNLTFDRSWDTVLCLEGTPTRRPVGASRDLELLVRDLPELATQPLGDARRDMVEQLAAEAGRTVFETPAPFTWGPVFHAIGVPEGNGVATFGPTVEGTATRILCVSPFLSPDTVKRAGKLAGGERILVSRGECLAQIPEAALKGWKVRTLSDAAVTGEKADEDDDELTTGGSFLSPPSGLHAKIVGIEDHKRRVSWWLGSANLTNAGWNGLNVELMVELGGGRKEVGIDAFLDDGFGEVLEDWQPTEPDPEELARQEAQAKVDAARDALAAAGFRLQCRAEDSQWSLELQGTVGVGPGVEVTAWPVTLVQAQHEKPIAHGDEGPVVWSPLSAASLTSLIAFEARVGSGRAAATARFALQLQIADLPDDRDAHIVRNIVATQSAFLRYLRLLLALADGAPFGKVALPFAARGRGRGDEGSGMFEELVLENLLRVLSREPARLQAVQRLVDDMSKTDEGRALMPAEFLELWDVVRTAMPEASP